MINFIIIINFLQIIILTTQNISNIRYNSLISAQCKARCLYEYRKHHYQQHRLLPSMFIDEKTKTRLLTTNVLTLPWRSIWERCPRLITCSSCLLPCDLDPPLLLSNEQSCQAICSTLKIVECEESCIFIQNLYYQQLNCLTDNCQLCSSLNNCSENIPQPYNITAIERKSRRTVRLKWKSDRIKNIEPVFYVIEAQWTLLKSDIVSKWGFVKEEVSHTKAIIRNIQRDNRWYKFRIAAVTRHGYSAFSMTTKPFRLTNQSQIVSSIIDSPKNFSIKDYQLNLNTMNVTLIWQKPDLPVNGYQISWESENNQSSSLVNTIDISSSLYPLEFTIPFLSIDKSYLFKIRSMVLSEGNHIEMSLPIIINFNNENELFSIKNFQISKAFFSNGLIKINISWNKIDDYRIKQYNIYWIENECYSNILSCCYRRDAVTIKNFFQLDDLRYNCKYLVNIKVINLLKINKTYQYYFNVNSCELTDVYGTIQPPCQNDRKIIDVFSSLPSFDFIVTKNRSGLNLFWKNIYLSKELINNVFYQLYIEQIPNHIEIISIKFPLLITNYFIPYSKNKNNRYFNITLSLIDNTTIRQQQSILINDQYEEYIYDLFNISSSLRNIYFKYILLFVLLILYNNND